MALPTTGLTGHFDASDTDNLWKTFVSGGPHTDTPVDGDSIQVWGNETGADRIFKHFTVGTAPVWRQTTPLMLLPCLDFTGGQRLVLTNNTNTSQPLSTLIANNAFTVLIAFYAETVTSTTGTVYNGHPLINDTGQFWGLFLRLIGGIPKLSVYNWDGSADVVTLDSTVSASHVVMIRHQSSILYISLDGGTESSIASGNTTNIAQGVNVGHGSVAEYDGRIGEIAVYNVALTGTDLTDAIDYFMEKWITGPPASIELSTTFIVKPVGA